MSTIYGEVALKPTSTDGEYQTTPYAPATTDQWDDLGELAEAIITGTDGAISCVDGHDRLPAYLQKRIHYYPDLCPVVREAVGGMRTRVVFCYIDGEDGEHTYSAIVEMSGE